MSIFKGFTSQIVHHDRALNATEGGASIHTPIYNSVPYSYDDAHDIESVFQGKMKGFVYARSGTPTLQSLQSLVNQMEAGHGTLVFATGMSALQLTWFSLLTQGDHLIVSRYLFGNTYSLLNTLKGFGVEISVVDTTDVEQVIAAAQPNTKMVFTETIANPGTQIADLEAIGQWCQTQSVVFFVDNTLTSPYLFQPKQVGASLVMNSLSKYVSGHGYVLGGSVTDTGLFDWSNYPNIAEPYRKYPVENWALMQLSKKGMRDMGATMSSDSASLIALGAETLALRFDRICHNAMMLAQKLDQHSAIERVYYPGLESHPQHSRAARLFKGFGGLVSFDLKAGYDSAEWLNRVDIALNATHLGDNRTLSLPMASTIFFEMGAEKRAEYGVGDQMIRCSIGIEDTEDLLNSFEQALQAVT